MKPTREQLIENIKAMESQGAPSEDIQAYLDSFKETPVASPEKKKDGFIKSVFKEEIGKAAVDVTPAFEKGTPLMERGARLALAPLRAVGAGVRISGRLISRPVVKAVEKTADVISDVPLVQKAAMSKAGDVAEETVADIGGKVSGVLTSIKDIVPPEIYNSIADIAEIALTYSGGKVAQAPVKAGVQATKQIAKETAEGAAKAGKEAVENTIARAKDAGRDIASSARKLKDKATGVTRPTGEEKIYFDAVEISRQKIDADYEQRSAREGRTYTEGRLKTVKMKPTRREELVADAIRPLVEQGRISSDKLPFENIPEIAIEVNRINRGVGEMIVDNKVPFNKNQLKTKLAEVKKDADIIFTTDPTLERTYDRLIEAFLQEVDVKDTKGLFDARQSFDKLPAVRKLLETEVAGENLRNQAVRDLRRAANEYIAEQLPPNNPYRALLQQESLMLEAIDNLAVKSRGLKGSTGVSRTLDESPVLKKVLQQAVPFSVGGIVF